MKDFEYFINVNSTKEIEVEFDFDYYASHFHINARAINSENKPVQIVGRVDNLEYAPNYCIAVYDPTFVRKDLNSSLYFVTKKGIALNPPHPDYEIPGHIRMLKTVKVFEKIFENQMFPAIGREVYCVNKENVGFKVEIIRHLKGNKLLLLMTTSLEEIALSTVITNMGALAVNLDNVQYELYMKRY